MIGLVDADCLRLSQGKKLYIPNVEILKLATYLTQEERQYCRLLSLDDDDLDRYDKIYFCSELSKDIPMNYRRAKTLELHGSAFHHKGYVPFENIMIDFTIPRTFIYKEFLQTKMAEGVDPKDINAFLDNGYYRMYAGDKKLPSPPIYPRKKIYIFDKDFFVDGWEAILRDINKKRPTSINCIHPIECNSLKRYFELRNYDRFSRTNEIILNLPMTLEDVPYLFKNYTRKFLGDIMLSSNVRLPIGGSYKFAQEYYANLIYTLNLLYSYWAHDIPMKLKYIEPPFGVINPIGELEQALVNWANLDSTNKKTTTLYNIITKYKKYQFALMEYETFTAFHPSMAMLFKQTYENLRRQKLWLIR